MGGGGNSGSDTMMSGASSPGAESPYAYGEGEGGEGSYAQAAPAALEPSEAAAAGVVLGRLFEKLSLLSLLKVDASVQAAELSRSVGEEISRVMEKQQGLERRFESLISVRGVLKAMPNKTKYKENQEELHRVAEELRATTTQLCRNLRDNPDVADNMAKVHVERGHLQVLLSQVLNDLEGAAYPSLTNMVRDEDARDKNMKETIAREKAASDAVRQLRETIRSEKDGHEAYTTEKREVMSDCKEQLKNLKATKGVELRYLDKDLRASNQCSSRVGKQTLGSLAHEIESLHAQIAMERQVHASSTEFLKKRNGELTKKVAAWVHKHDDDKESKERALTELKANYQRDLARLKEMEEAYQQEMYEKDLRLAETRRAAELAFAKEAEDEKRARAARKIQSLYRVWKAGGGVNAKKGGKKAKGKAKGKKK